MDKNLMADFGKPILVLLAICLVTSAALAVTQMATAPVIAAAEAAAAEEARTTVLPGSSSFEKLTLTGLPGEITDVYKSDKGFVVQAKVKGYGGPISLIAGVDNDGKIVKTAVLTQSETAGLGSKTAEEPFQSQFMGKDKSLEGVSAIAGATISSKAVIGGISKVFEAVEIAKGGASTTPATPEKKGA